MRRAAATIGLGAVLGALLLHPATMVVYWFEFHDVASMQSQSLWSFVGHRMAAAFGAAMWPMSVVFAVLGAAFGAVFAAVDARQRRLARAITQLRQELSEDVTSLIAQGESERLEFKSTARWDLRQGRVNKALAQSIAKTIAALANHRGGSLLIGVADDGSIVGIEHDYRTLRKPNRDGFEQFLMTLVRERLGAHVCRLIHPLIAQIDGKDVCRVVVEPAPSPVFVDEQGTARLYVRTGNATRALDARETLEFVSGRWPSHRMGRR